MKLLRHGPLGSEKPGAVDADGKIRDLSGRIDDVNGSTLSDASIEKLRALDLSSLPEVSDSVRLGACVGSVGKLVCVGLNYSDHAAESGLDLPPEPVLFFKARPVPFFHSFSTVGKCLMNIKVAIFITMLAISAAVSTVNTDPRNHDHSATADVTVEVVEDATY